MSSKDSMFAFFGTPTISRIALETLVSRGLKPKIVVTEPDKPKGRGLKLSPTPVKEYASSIIVPVLTPTKINQEFITLLQKEGPFDFFVVFAYGKILPKEFLKLPKFGTLNIHPSLLPKYRGPAPLEAVLLSDDTETGVTIMQLDEQVDHGPIVLQEKFPLPKEETISTLSQKSAILGSALLLGAMEGLKNNSLFPTEQLHAEATFTNKITKEDGEIILSDDPWLLWKKFRALAHRPGIYFFTVRNSQKVRVKIKTARYENGQFIPETVIPENGKPIPFTSL